MVLRVNAMRFPPFIQRLSPAYVQEIHSLADGARISLPDAVLCQARAEASKRWDGGCTDVAIVLRVRPNDGRPAAIMFPFAGVCHFVNLVMADGKGNVADVESRPRLERARELVRQSWRKINAPPVRSCFQPPRLA